MHKISVVSLFALGVVVFASTNASAQPAQPDKPPAAQAGKGKAAAKPKKGEAKKAAAKKPEKGGAGEKPDKGDAGTPAAGKAAEGQADAGAGDEAGAQPSAGEQPSDAGGGTTPGEAPPRPPETTRGTELPGASPAPAGGGLGPMPGWPAPGSDKSQLEKQGEKRPGAENKKSSGESQDQVYAEDWWSHARPILELHGYFRLRAELFHNFSLGRIDPPDSQLWPAPADNNYVGGQSGTGGPWGPALCTGKQSPEAPNSSSDPAQARWPCKNKTQAGANIRFRLNPELHISDNLRIMSQIDLLDNLVLGSTPEGYANQPGQSGGYSVVQRGGYAPLGAFDTTQEPPSAGVNGLKDSIRVKRVWAEYMSPVGQLSFGRMPSQWGLGILANSGDGYDDDYQSTADRIMFVTGIKAIDLYFAGAWDFPNEGPTSAQANLPGAQPYDLAQLDDVNQYVLVVVRKTNANLQKMRLARGQLVVNGGAYVVYRSQLLANDRNGACPANAIGCTTGQLNPADSTGYVRRGAKAWIPDLWLQVLYKKFRFEMEAVTIQGSIENTLSTPGTSDYGSAFGGHGWKVQQYGLATELEQKLIEDRLRLQFKFGIASGDSNVNGLSPGVNGLQTEHGSNTISTFRFHPNYKIDLILNRNILNRIQGEYYFRPSADYDFLRNQNGQKLGGGVAAIWTRASEFVQTPGHDANLGVELDGKLYFQSKDGSLNDDPNKMGGFYTMLEYGVLFPLAGLGYPSAQANQIRTNLNNPGAANTSTAQVVRWYLGVLF